MTCSMFGDPGAHDVACAYFVDRVLVLADFAVLPAAMHVDIVVIEAMQLDERSKSIDLRHVLACQAAGHRAGGFLEGHGARAQYVTPTEWKGSEQKPIQHARAWAVLSLSERAVLGGDATYAQIQRAIEKGALKRWHISGAECYPRKWRGHNLLDSVSMGCVYHGRMERR